jgi:hypothetical protein
MPGFFIEKAGLSLFQPARLWMNDRAGANPGKS